MSPRRTFWSSTVGSKLLVGITGFLLVGFLVMHLAGNLLLYVGPATFNRYSHALISNPLVIPAELGLVALFLLHAFKTVRLTLASRHARRHGYAVKAGAGHTSRKTPASSTMILSGLFLLVFVPVHVRTFKYGAYYEAGEAGVRDLYRLVVEIFSQPAYVAFYAAGMVVVGFHLWHGVSSAVQTMGADTPRVTPVVRKVGGLLAALLTLGFLSIPLVFFFFGGRP